MADIILSGMPGSGTSSLLGALAHAGLPVREVPVDQLSVEAANLVVFTVSARDGLPNSAADSWELLAESFTPRILVWTFADVGRADDDDMRAIAERILGEPTFAIALPLADDNDDFAGVLDLRDFAIHDGSGIRAADNEHRDLAQSLADELMDAALTAVDDSAALETRRLGLHLSASRVSTLITDAIKSGQLVVSMPVKAVGETVSESVGEKAVETVGVSLLASILSEFVE